MVQRTIYTVQVTKEFYIQYTREVSTMHALHVRTWRRLSQGQFPTTTVEEKGEQGGDHLMIRSRERQTTERQFQSAHLP